MNAALNKDQPGAAPPFDPRCRARKPTQPNMIPRGFAICHAMGYDPCQYAVDLGQRLVLCRHPLHADIVARTVATDQN